MRLNDYFQKIFCINLDRRPDRWSRCAEIFAQNDLTVERVSAMDGNLITVAENSRLSNGEVGCIESHLGILRRMVAENLDNVLILEDDVEFRDGWQYQFETAVGNMPRWDMLYLGCNHVTKPIPFQANVVRLTRGYTTSSYAIKKQFAELVIPELASHSKQVDVVYSLRNKSSQCYAIKPGICYQRADHSDIQGAHTDYTQHF